MTTRELIGKVIDDSGNPQAETEVWLSAAGVATAKGKTDQNGNFEIPLDAAFVAGTYRLEAPATQSTHAGDSNVDLRESGPPTPVELTVNRRGGAGSVLAGWIFLLVLIGAVGLLTTSYLDLHDFNRDDVEQQDFSSVEKAKKISKDLSNLLDIARTQAEAAAAAELAETQEPSDPDKHDDKDKDTDIDKDGGKPTAAGEALAKSMAVDSLSAAEEIFADIKKRRLGSLDASKVAAVESLFGQAKKAAEANDLKGLATSIAYIQEAVFEPQEPFFWSEKPAILLESLYWALAATLIRLIFNTGYYLYKRRFLATAIPHHIAMAVSVPIMAVLISFFLSLVEISISLSELELSLDMGNVYIVILVAALIGFAPWKAWDFMQDLADRMFEALGRVLSRDTQ